jgi:hypothetical protein
MFVAWCLMIDLYVSGYLLFKQQNLYAEGRTRCRTLWMRRAVVQKIHSNLLRIGKRFMLGVNKVAYAEPIWVGDLP